MRNNAKNMKLQKEFIKRLFIQSNVSYPEAPDLLQLILTCDKEILKTILGDAGYKLKELVDSVDLNHPDINSIFNGVLDNEQQFAQQCIEIIKFAEIAKENDFKHLLSLVGKTVIENTKNNFKLIDFPVKNRMNVRFLKDPEEREELRMQKRMQLIDLRSFCKKGLNFWDSLPLNFSKFIRFDDAYQEDLQKAEKKAKQYEDLGCTSLAEEIKKTIETFKSNMKQAYFGFNRITMTNAAAILAKSLDYSFLNLCESWSTLESNNYILLEKSLLENIVSEHLVYFSNKVVASKNNKDFYFYEPRVYPYHLFSDVASEETKKIINHLENFPEANDKPIFDHFGIIIPSIRYFDSKSSAKEYLFKDEKGSILTFLSKDEIIYKLDKTFLEKKHFDAIIIAEKDGKCYFICYFD